MLSGFRLFVAGIALLTSSLLVANVCFAATLVSVDVLKDGKHVAGMARTHRGEDNATVWEYLKTDHLVTERAFDVSVSDDDPLKAVLTGKLELRLVYRNSDIAARAKVDKLTLVRRSPDSNEWFVDPADVDRTIALAGLKMKEKESKSAPQVDSRLVVVLIVACIAVGVFMLLRRRSAPATQ